MMVSYCRHCPRGSAIAWDGYDWYHEDTGLYGCPRADRVTMAEPGGKPRGKKQREQ